MSEFVKSLTDTQAQLVADVAAQAAEIAELKQFLADLIAPPQPEPVEVDSWRKIPEWSHDQRMAFVAEDAANREANRLAQQERLREGLSDGQWRDGGLIRDRQGKIVPSQELQAHLDTERAKFDEVARNDHFRWLKDQGLPIRHGADEDDAE
jgi:hypothetical protein